MFNIKWLPYRYHPIFFYATPGQYELKIDNGRYTKPEMMYEKIKLQANQLYFYGIEEHTYVFTTKFSFNKLSAEQGKHYLYTGGRFNKGVEQCKEISLQ